MRGYGRDYRRGNGTWGRGTYDLDYSAGYEGLENDVGSRPGNAYGQNWSNYYAGRRSGGYGINQGVGYDAGFRRDRGGFRSFRGGGYDRQMGQRYPLRGMGGYDFDYDANFGERSRNGWNELRRNDAWW
jgi:hypothetical protein